MSLKRAVATLWALLIGIPMGLVALFFGFAAGDALWIAVLGGLGAAAFIRVFWKGIEHPSTPSKPREPPDALQ